LPGVTRPDLRQALRPALLLDVSTGELLPDRAVLIEDERISGVVSANDVPDEIPTRDLPGLTLLPGLIDCHSHLVGEEDSGHGYTEPLTRTGAQEAMTGCGTRATRCRPGSPVCETSVRIARSSTSPCATPSTPAGRRVRG
jgi:imidazolonepropionase-like amidohydrolase